MLVDGEAGIGKSRLVAEAVTHFRELADLLIVGHGVELSGGELPYGMVSECLRGLVRVAGVEAVRAAAGDYTSELAALCPPLSPGVAVEPIRVERVQLFYGFVTTLETLAADRLVWLVLEDLHWADASSRDLLSYLLKAAGPGRLLTLVTVRTHDPAAGAAASDIVADLVRVDGVERISIGPLSRGEVADQIANLTQASASQALVDRVVELTRGVPFLTEQLIAAGLTETSAVPASVLEPMQARIRALDPDTQRLVQIASLADGHLTHDLLEQAFQRETRTVGEDSFGWAVATAVDARVLRFDPDEHTYTFVHALLRQSVDGMVSPVHRRRLHRTLATLCAEAPGQTADLRLPIAAVHHWVQAGADPEAFDATFDVAARCHRLGAIGEMANLLVRALELWDRVPDAAERAGRDRDRLLFDALQALDEASDFERALALLDTELRRSDAGDDPIRNLCLRLERDALGLDLARDTDTALHDEAVEALDALMAAEPNPVIITGLFDVGWQLAFKMPERALEIDNHALGLAEQLGDRTLVRMGTEATSAHMAYQGQFDAAAEACKQLLDQSGYSAVELADIEYWHGLWLMNGGCYAEARSAFERVLERLSDPRLAPSRWTLTTAHLCLTLVALGKWGAALDLLDRLGKVPPSPGWRTVFVAEAAGGLACQCGDLKTAQHWSDIAATYVPSDEDELWLPMRASYRFLRAQIAAERGDLHAAREELAPILHAAGTDRVHNIWRQMLFAAQIEANIAGGIGKPPNGTNASTVDAIREVADQVPKRCQLAHAWSAHLDAELARVDGHHNPAAWSGVVAAWRAVGHVPYLAYSLMRLAAAHLAAGDRDAATAPLFEAFQIASDLGAAPLRLRVVDLAHHSRIHLDDGTARQPTGAGRLGRLTAREVEVLRLVAQGMSNNEIAEKLFISPKTASVHVSRILTKLGVNSRAKATAIAYEEHILTNGK